MDASYKIQRGIHVHLIQFFMCPEFWVHINISLRSSFFGKDPIARFPTFFLYSAFFNASSSGTFRIFRYSSAATAA